MDASVIVVGAGPAGLMLAGELRLAGVRVIVLERLSRPSGESRGMGLTIRTVEVLDQRGLIGRFGEMTCSVRGHFGGIPLDMTVLGASAESVSSVPQSVTESVLESWASELGADIRRGHELTGLRQADEHVEAEVKTPDGPVVLRAAYLVGADGGRSIVRHLAGFDFPGTEATTELLLADIRGVEIAPRAIGQISADGMVMSAALPDGVFRVIVGERGVRPQHRDGPPRFEEVADTWKRLTGEDIRSAEPVWVSAFTDAARQADRYQQGRVLLCGDAAHIHLPAGGQGMNTSIQDAVNLGWKLGATVCGRAGSGLLASYHDERHEVGRRLLENTRAQALLILGGEEAAPIRSILASLFDIEEVQRRLAGRVSGVDIRYDVGAGSHPLLGRRLPNVRLTVNGQVLDSSRLLWPGRGVLLDLTGNPRLRERVGPWLDRIDVVTAAVADRQEGPGAVSRAAALGTALMVRPDGYVVWAAPGTQHDLPSALTRWFGPARRRATSGPRPEHSQKGIDDAQ